MKVWCLIIIIIFFVEKVDIKNIQRNQKMNHLLILSLFLTLINANAFLIQNSRNMDNFLNQKLCEAFKNCEHVKYQLNFKAINSQDIFEACFQMNLPIVMKMDRPLINHTTLEEEWFLPREWNETNNIVRHQSYGRFCHLIKMYIRLLKFIFNF